MASSDPPPASGYVLGLDGLPLGTHAAIASGGTVLSTFAVVDRAARPRPLEARLREALVRAEALVGSLPSEVRLVCYDDGEDGRALARLGEWLATAGGIPLRVLDPGPGPGSGGTGEADLVRESMARARHAALS